VSGQVVDTITNIKTVKLFAHAAHEDRAALKAMETYREKAIGFGAYSALFRVALMTLAGTLPAILIGGTLACCGPKAPPRRATLRRRAPSRSALRR
jgi:ATP-binding cassette, subfamily B, bacterial